MNSSWGLNLLHFALSWSQSVLLQLVSKHISNLNLLERTWRPKKSKHKIGEAYVKSLSLTLLKHVFLTPNQDPWSDKSSCRYEDGEKNWNVLETSELSWPWLWKIWMESMLIPNSRIPISTSLSIYAGGGGMAWWEKIYFIYVCLDKDTNWYLFFIEIFVNSFKERMSFRSESSYKFSLKGSFLLYGIIKYQLYFNF